MADLEDLKKGDRVRWRTSQGKTTGKVVRIMTKPFSIKGTDLKASKDDPRVLVESEKTGAEAGHKPSALQKLGKAKDSTSKDSKSKDSKTKDSKSKDSKSKAKDSSSKDAKAKSKDSKSKAKDSKSKDAKATSKGSKSKG